MTERSRPTYRQLRLLAWLRDPTRNNPDLPQHEAIRWDEATWTTTEIMERSGVYTKGQRKACQDDYRALLQMGRLIPGAGGWRLAPEGAVL